MRLSFLVLSLLTYAAGAERETPWSGLPTIISGKQVIAELYAGGTVDGKVISVNSTELRMNVFRSDDARYAASMEHRIPRPASLDSS